MNVVLVTGSQILAGETGKVAILLRGRESGEFLSDASEDVEIDQKIDHFFSLLILLLVSHSYYYFLLPSLTAESRNSRASFCPSSTTGLMLSEEVES